MPNIPASASGAMERRISSEASFNKVSLTWSRSWVSRCQTLAVNRNRGLFRTRRAQAEAYCGLGGA